MLSNRFRDYHVPNAEKEYPCSYIVQMGDAKTSVRERKEANFRYGNIKKIEGLDKAWMFIKEIYLCGNEIVTIEGLSSCKYLVELSLIGNQITAIPTGAFDGLVNLEKLYLHDNEIATIEHGALNGLVQLEVLSLSDNRIKKIQGLESQSLKTLRISRNQISDEEDLAYLGQTLTKLEELSIDGNPLCPEFTGTKAFARKVKAAIPQLQRLKGQDINDMRSFD